MESTQFAPSRLSTTVSSLAGARREPRSLRRILEKRVLLDASAPADTSQAHMPATEENTGGTDTDQSDNGNHGPHAPAGDQSQAEGRNEIVVIDTTIEDAQALVDDLVQQADSVTDRGNHMELQIGAREIALYTIDDSASVATIGNLLAEQGRTDALHLVTHGGAGGIDIGGDSLSLDSLQSFGNELQNWSNHFSSGADILLYGCDVSYNDTGEDFILQFSQLTGADIAASDDPTGSIAHGGDWDLEHQRGPIETNVIFSQLLQGEWDGLLAAVPSATVEAADEDFINETTDVTFAFDNNDVDTGYGPFMDVVLGPGMTVESVGGFLGATFIEYTVVDGQWVDNSGNPVEFHPYDVNQTGDIPLPPVGPEGSHWYAIELPFGSFTPDQPAYEFVATILLDEAAGAQVGVPIPIYVRSGFMYGEDPLNNPDSDPPIVGPEITTDITPTVMLIDKEARDGDGDNDSIGDDGETVTGPSEPVTWAVTVDIANMSPVEDLVVTEEVPSNFYYLPGNVVVTDSAGNTLVEGTDYTLTEPPEGANNDAELVVEFLNPVEGTLADDDIVITYTGYVPDVDANGEPIVINDAANDGVQNTASATGTYQDTEVSDDDTDTITATATAVQKDVALVDDTGSEGFTPGDGLEYTLTLEVSDYMQMEDLVLSDVLQDGLEVDPDSVAFTLFVNGTSIGPVPFGSGNFTLVENPDPGDGSTELTFDLSQELIDQGLSDGSLDGDLFADGVTDGTTTITITYEATIREAYIGVPRAGTDNEAVDTYDTLTNQATINASAASANGEAVNNGSSEEVVIEGAESDKSVYAVNGNTEPVDEITVGDEVTFAIDVDLATLDSQGIVITDYLPLPVFEAMAPTFFDTGEGADIPAANQWGFGPETDFGNWPPGYLDGGNVTTTADSANNSITWTFDPVEQDNSQGGHVQLVFTVEVQDEPFTDGLFLTNVASVSIDGTETTTDLPEDGTQVEILSPEISVTKGVVDTDDENGVLDPDPSTPVAFDPAGTAATPGTPPWTAPITSSDLDDTPIDSNLSNVDAGDTVRFAIVLENSGGSDAFDLEISDILPEGFDYIDGNPANLNLQVYTGDGTEVTFSGDLFGSGITLDDPSADEGALNQGRDPDTGDTTDGSNIIVITYDLETTDDVQPNQQIENTAQLEAYGGIEGGNDYTEGNTNINWQDDALVATRENTVDKTLDDTSINSDNNADDEAVIGEVITYTLTLTIAEGMTPSASIVDTLDQGLEFIDVTDVTFSGDISSTVNLNTLNGTASGQQVTFDLGDLTNANRDNTVDETISITYEVLVANDAVNQSGDQVNNSAQFRWDSTADDTDNPTAQDTASAGNVMVIEPDLQVDKSLVDTTQPVDAGDEVTYEIVIFHSEFSDTDAFDATFSDQLPADLENFMLVSVTHSSEGDITGNFEIAGDTLQTVSGESFDLLQGETVTIQVSGEVIGTITPNTTISNTATTDWTSIDGDDLNERTGDDGEGGAVDDYETSDTLNFVTASVEAGKQLISSSIIDDSNGATEGVIGETLTYVSGFLVPEGGAPVAEILDTLPEGVEFVSLDQVFVGANISFDNGNFTEPAAGSTGTISFGTADLLNAADGVQDENDIIAVVYTVRIQNVDSNQAGTVLTNQAEFRWDETGNGSNTDAGDGSVTASTDATVIEPQLQIDKSVSTTEADNGDPFEYTITVTNPDDGTSTTAYDISFSDPLPDELADATFTATLETDAGTTDISGHFEIVAGELVLSPQAELDLAPGGVVTITVSGSLTNALAGSTFDNTATASWTSLDGDDPNERTGADGEGGDLDDYETSDNVPLSVPDPEIDKSLVSTSQNDDLNDDTEATIGEIVTFETVLTLPEATLIGEILDNYGPGFEFVDLVSVKASNPDAIQIDFDQITVIDDPGNNTVGFDFGTLVNTDTDNSTIETITFTYRLRVTDAIGNQGGTTLTNDAILNYDTDGDDAPDTEISDDATVGLVEPEVTVDKELLSPAPLTLGGTAQYQITVQLDPSSTADAYNVHIEDALPPYLSGVNDVQIDVTGGSPEVINNSTDNMLDLDISVIDSTTVVTITVDAQVTSDPDAVGQTTTNTTATEWTSIDGFSLNERTGADGEGGDLDDYADSDEVTADIEAFDLFVAKDDQGVTAEPGDTVIYTIDYGNDGTVDTTGVVITEILPPNTTFDPSNSTSGWVDNGDGTFSFTVGDLAAGETGSIDFAVIINEPLPTGVEETSNTVTIDDDGTHGIDFAPDNNDDDDNTPIDAAPDYVIEKTEDFDDPAFPGETISWTITVTNEGNQDGTGVVVTDTLPDSPYVSDYTASDGGIVDEVAGTVIWNIGDMAVGDTITLTLTGEVASEGVPPLVPTATNTVEVDDDGTNGPDPTPENNTDSEDFDITEVDLAITKDDGGITTTPGGSVTYTLNYANNGSAPAEDAEIVETLPDYVTFDPDDPDNAGWVDNGDGTITLDLGTLDEGESGTATFTVIVDDPLPAGVDEILNTTVIHYNDGLGPDQNIDDNDDDDNTPVDAAPDYVIVKEENFEDPAHPGDPIEWSITVSNEGNQDGTGVVVTDQLPDTDVFTDFVASDGGVIDLAAGTVTWEIGDLAAGDSLTLTLSATVAAEGLPAQIPPQENAVEVTDDGNNGPDPTPDNNRDLEPLDVEFVDLTVDKTEHFDDPAHPGDSVSWTIEVTNEGNTTSTGVVVTDTLPDRDIFTGFVASDGGEVDLEAGTVTWTLDELAAGETATFSLSAVVLDNVPTEIPPQENSVSVTDDGSHGLDPTPENNTDTEPLSVEYVDLVIDKDNGGIVARPTDSYIYTLNFENSGTATAEGVVITETLPPNTTFNPANSTPGWVQDGDTFTFEVGSLNAGESGSIQFAVIVDFPLDPMITGTQNTATITDDGASGPDQDPSDNTDDEITEIRAQPQVDNITLSSLHWKMDMPQRAELDREPEMYGRLISRETEEVTANLQGSRSGHHFDPVFGAVDGTFYPNDWSPVFDELSGYWLSPTEPAESGGGKESPLQLDDNVGDYRAESLFGTFGKSLISAADNDEENRVQQQLDEIEKDMNTAGVAPVLNALAQLAATENSR